MALRTIVQDGDPILKKSAARSRSLTTAWALCSTT